MLRALLQALLVAAAPRLARKRAVFRANRRAVSEAGDHGPDDPLARWLALPAEKAYALLVRNLAADLAALVSGRIDPPAPPDPESEATLRTLERGGLLLSAHFGNHELVAKGCADAGMRILSSAQPQKNRRAQRILDRRRASWNAPAEDFSGKLFRAAAHVRSGGVVGLMTDQDPGPSGLDDSFLGVPCKSSRLADLLWLRCGKPPVVFGRALTGRTDSPRVEYFAGKEGEAPSAFAKRMVEACVRERPELWYGWIHRRFKSTRREIYP